MIQKTRNIIKYKVFFRRVSTSNQDLAMQESADAIFRKNYVPSEILILNENGISANKLDIQKRPQMKKLIDLITNNQVEMVYAFDRSRLFRDFYESNYFVSICKKHNVKIFYTSAGNGQQQALDSTLLEGVMNIVSDVEGSNIARRTEEARKRYPARKLGYLKEKETKQYIKDSGKQDSLLLFFSALEKVASHQDLEQTLKEFKTVLKTSKAQLMKIAMDPFYAGYDLTIGQNKLPHVEPYLSYTQYVKLQTKKSLIKSYLELERSLNSLELQNVFCGICRKPMKFKFNVPEEAAWYTCSNKHQKIIVSSGDITEIVTKSLKIIIDSLDTNLLLKDSKQFFIQTRKLIQLELKKLEREKNILLEKIILDADDVSNWRYNPDYLKLKKLENIQANYRSELDEKKNLLLANERLASLVQNYLQKCRQANPFFLASMLIQKIYVYPKEINIKVNSFEYLKNFQTQYIYAGDDLF